MTGFDLPTNYVEDLKALIRRARDKLKKVPALKSEDNHMRQSLTPKFEAMANRILREFSALTNTIVIAMDMEVLRGALSNTCYGYGGERS